MSAKPSYLNFDNSNYPWKKDIDYRVHPHEYKVGKGEQGVLICEPYKSEIGKYWRFKSPEIANISSNRIFEMFISYLTKDDFVGADMARKYLQMGYTRSRRYANYKGGVKYNKDNNYTLNTKGCGEASKAVSANIFFAKWKEAEANKQYQDMKLAWKKLYG